MRTSVIILGVLLACVMLAQTTPAQQPKAVKANQRETARIDQTVSGAAPQPALDTYSYEFKQPAFYISHIVIATDAAGRGTVTFEHSDAPDEPITDPFEFSPTAWARVRGLWDELRFLDSQESYQTERQYPHLGTMWLRQTQGTRSRTAEFNWTNHKTAEALVNEYRHAADQAQFVFDINLARENQPLGAPKLLERLEQLYQRKGLSDAQQLAPFLRELSTDERIPLMARNRAAKVLAAIEKNKP